MSRRNSSFSSPVLHTLPPPLKQLLSKYYTPTGKPSFGTDTQGRAFCYDESWKKIFLFDNKTAKITAKNAETNIKIVESIEDAKKEKRISQKKQKTDGMKDDIKKKKQTKGKVAILKATPRERKVRWSLSKPSPRSSVTNSPVLTPSKGILRKPKKYLVPSTLEPQLLQLSRKIERPPSEPEESASSDEEQPVLSERDAYKQKQDEVVAEFMSRLDEEDQHYLRYMMESARWEYTGEESECSTPLATDSTEKGFITPPECPEPRKALSTQSKLTEVSEKLASIQQSPLNSAVEWSTPVKVSDSASKRKADLESTNSYESPAKKARTVLNIQRDREGSPTLIHKSANTK